MERRAYRKLCGAVAVDDLDRGLLERQHLLATHHEELQWQVGVFVDHRHTKLGAHGHTGNAVLDNVRIQEFQVFTDLFRHDIAGASCCQRREQVVERSVKRETGMARQMTVLVKTQLCYSPCQEG